MRTVLIISSMFLLASHAWAGSQKTAAIAADTSSLNQKVATEIQEGINAQVVDGFGAARITVAPTSDARIVGRARDCAGATCLQEIARGERLDLVVQIKVQVKKPGKKGKADYDISMVVAQVSPEVDSWREKIECPGCGAEDVDHMVSLLATTIGEKIAKDASVPAAAPALPPVAAVTPQPVPLPAPPVSIADPSVPPEGSWSVPWSVSGSVLAGGVVLGLAGWYLVHINGKGICDLSSPKEHCPDRYKTSGLGYGLIAGGGAAALGGLLGLIFLGPQTARADVAVGFDGSSILFSGVY
jgi:hypothetical protein